MRVSERNFLERVADLVPGISGYRAKEARRETDRRLREWMARRLEEGRDGIQLLRRNRVSDGALEGLDRVGGLDAAVQKAIASLRYADRGYSGLFDALKIREEELDRLYEHDLGLVDEVESLAASLSALGGASGRAADVDALAARAEELSRRVARRREIFEAPATPDR